MMTRARIAAWYSKVGDHFFQSFTFHKHSHLLYPLIFESAGCKIVLPSHGVVRQFCTAQLCTRKVVPRTIWQQDSKNRQFGNQGCIFRLTCSHPELTEDHVLTSVYVKNFRTVTRNAVNKSVWRKKDCSWPLLNKHAMNIWLSSLRIRAHLSWRTGKHLHVLHVLRTYSTCSYPGY